MSIVSAYLNEKKKIMIKEIQEQFIDIKEAVGQRIMAENKASSELRTLRQSIITWSLTPPSHRELPEQLGLVGNSLEPAGGVQIEYLRDFYVARWPTSTSASDFLKIATMVLEERPYRTVLETSESEHFLEVNFSESSWTDIKGQITFCRLFYPNLSLVWEPNPYVSTPMFGMISRRSFGKYIEDLYYATRKS